MSLIEIVTIVSSSLIVFGNIGVFVYKKIKHLPTGDCQYCSYKNKNIIEEYRKFVKENNL